MASPDWEFVGSGILPVVAGCEKLGAKSSARTSCFSRSQVVAVESDVRRPPAHPRSRSSGKHVHLESLQR